MTDTTTSEPGLQASLADLLEVLGRTSDAMIAIDPELNVIGWNEAATLLLGYSAEQALGTACHEILSWRDRCGDSVCGESCQSIKIGKADEIIPTREVLGRSATGKTLWLSASTIVPPLALRSQCRVIHLVREVSLPPELERVIVERLQILSPAALTSENSALEVLTPREREVLEHMTEGLGGAAIAEKLFISPATVRNHIQHILTKLGVHSRAEAVGLALRSS